MKCQFHPLHYARGCDSCRDELNAHVCGMEPIKVDYQTQGGVNCGCGKPGAYRGDPDKSYQTMRCTDCCAADAVKAALERQKPPLFMSVMAGHIEAAAAEVRLAFENTSCLRPALREELQRLLASAEDKLVWAARRIKESM